LIELVAVIVIVVLLAMVLVGALARHTPSRRKAPCKENLSTIGRAMTAYTLDNGEYFPFSWGPADGRVDLPKDAMTSIGTLYPDYLDSAKVFRCPTKRNKPRFVCNPRKGKAGQVGQPPNRNWTLGDTGYGYDCRISPIMVSNHAIAADMDGSFQVNRDTRTQNHESGQNVLYVDGAVRWVTTNYASDSVDDNIFTETGAPSGGITFSSGGGGDGGWHADTDSFISDNTNFLDPDDPAATFTDLEDATTGYGGRGGSYYEKLRP